jgi:hypothetical protein
MAGDQPVSWLMFFTFAATIFIIAGAYISFHDRDETGKLQRMRLQAKINLWSTEARTVLCLIALELRFSHSSRWLC